MMSAHYTVFGNPIAHSKSPQIHQLFAKQEGVSIEYSKTLVQNSLKDFQAALNVFFHQQNGNGANVTLPFKEYAFTLCPQLSHRAQAAGAVNTLFLKDTHILFGDNTDGLGLVNDLKNNIGTTFSGSRVLILGAGGAARGVILPIKYEQPNQIIIANRTHEKAQKLADEFGIIAQTFEQLSGRFDIIINATSSSISEAIPNIAPQCFLDSIAYDMFYASNATPFMQTAKQYGATQIVDGLGMLVEQAAAAYQLWRNFTPDTASVIATIRAQM